MALYSYNGTVLQERPTTSGYQMIYRSGEFYFLACSNTPYTRHNGSMICVPEGAAVTAYATMANASIWVEAEYTPDNSNPDAEYWQFLGLDQFIWTSHDIRDVSLSYDDDGNIIVEDTGLAYAGSEPVWAAPDVPIIDYFGWTDGDGTYNTSTLTVPVRKDGWHLTVDFRIAAHVTDGGRLLLGWYRSGTLLTANVSYSGSISSTCPIDNSTVGTYTYQVVIYNTLNEVDIGKQSAAVTVNVVDWDYDDFDPDTGGDTGGTFPPGTIQPDPTPDPDPDPDPEPKSFCPTSFSLGIATGYDLKGGVER